MVDQDVRMRVQAQRDGHWAGKRLEALVGVPNASAWLRRLTLVNSKRMSEAERLAAGRFSVTALSDGERGRLFAGLFPKMHQAVERAWQDLPGAGFDRGVGLGFRAPGHARVTRARREAWFAKLVVEVQGYEPDAPWLAAHAPYVTWDGAPATSRVLAAAIDLGGELGRVVTETLTQSATGRHDIGITGPHVIWGLLWSSRPDAWEAVVGLLLSAKREEGLRQAILEEAHTAHPGAFSRLLEVAEEEDLARFASTARAVNVWLQLLWDSASSGQVRSVIKRLRTYLEDVGARRAAIAGADAESVWIALWCEGFFDAAKATEQATAMLDDSVTERRWVAARMLGMLCVPEALPGLRKALRDAEMAVVAAAFHAVTIMPSWSNAALAGETDWESESELGADPEAEHEAEVAGALAEDLLALMGRLGGSEVKFEPLVFPWGRRSLKAAEVGQHLAIVCPDALNERLLDVIDRLDANGRFKVFMRWAPQGGGGVARQRIPPLSPAARAAMIRALGDPSKSVRSIVAERLAREPLAADEAARHEALLDGGPADARTRAVQRLLSGEDGLVLLTAERLLARSEKAARAGLELLGGLVDGKRSVGAARAMAERWKSSKADKASKESLATADMVGRERRVFTAADAFGLAAPFAERPLPPLKAKPVEMVSAAAFACLCSLDDLVEANKGLVLVEPSGRVVAEPGAGEGEGKESERPVVLGESEGLGRFGPGGGDEVAEQAKYACLQGLLEGWDKGRGKDTRDRDGLEIFRAWMMLEGMLEGGRGTISVQQSRAVTSQNSRLTRKIKHSDAVQLLVAWLIRRSTVDGVGFFLDGMETALRQGDVGRKRDFWFSASTSGDGLSVRGWLSRLEMCLALPVSALSLEHRRRRDGLVRAAAAAVAAGKAKDAAAESNGPLRPVFEDLEQLWAAGEVSDDEMLVTLCWVEQNWQSGYRRAAETLYGVLSRRLKRYAWEKTPSASALRLDALAERVRRRVLEIELGRLEGVTAATPHAFSLEPSGGIDAAVGALAALGRESLQRRPGHKDWSKQAVMSYLVRESRPGPQDTPEAFASAARAAGLSAERLVALAVFQPRWARHAEHATGWAGLEAAVLWVRAHTNARTAEDTSDDLTEAWESRVAELTPISPGSLRDGAVDRAWFERCYSALGSKRWSVVYDAAKYASNGAGHTRARLFADAMLGEVTEKDLLTRIRIKRHQDSARALGLVPLPAGKARTEAVLRRYAALQEMLRTSRKHGGSALQASEKRAVEIGLENLAWAAGYPDPLRLQWAMEIEQFGELAKGPVVVKVGDVTVTLSVDEQGVASLTASKAASGKAGKGQPAPEPKVLAAIPPAVKKDKRVAALAEQVKELRRQTSRVRDGLEGAMCRGDEFSGAELAELFGHPLLRPMLSRLVLMGRTSAGGELIGYPDKSGKALRGLDGELEPVKAGDRLRIAHPLDLLAGKQWHQWQAECFRAERVQPFKQVFREVYVPAAPESRGKGVSTRYDGQQVRPSQALALFGRRGWVARPEEGVQRTFHREGVTVAVAFQEGFYTPAEVDGLTLAGLVFRKAGSEEPMEVAKVPARVFSEVMRDVDLVVSVAHRGGVDPEASFSTVEMRAALVRETCALLSLSNVRIESNRAMIKGTLGDYAVHLGSGMITRLPGGLVWVVPVHSQHRGRVFLPFADDDPTTAEVVSKVLLLARDGEIRDPAILSQLRG